MRAEPACSIWAAVTIATRVLVRSKVESDALRVRSRMRFFRAAPRSISSEVCGPAKVLSTVWKRLPLPVTRVLGEALYRYMA